MIGCSSAVRYWWVNQNQTFRHELAGGYLWSPKRSANGARNPFYESMREVSPGDAIFSFVDTRIAAIGIAQSYCWESPKPVEFGEAGQNWENVGWKVKVAFTTLLNKVRPKDHMEILRTLLPSRYSPLQPNGNGIQSIYLTEVSPTFIGVPQSHQTVHQSGGSRWHLRPHTVLAGQLFSAQLVYWLTDAARRART